MNSFSNVRAGDYYLVDLGQLVPVAASSPRAAFHIASTGVFRSTEEFPAVHPLVYQLAPDGEVMAVYE